jgi:hypothetical protein
MKRTFLLGALALSLAACAKAPVAPPPASAPAAPEGASGAPQTIRGELVDLACYLDHGAKGDGHKACATSCALKGLPIGILDKDNKITLVIGEHDRSLNAELAPKMGTTIALTGKVVSRDGVQMIEVSGSE